MVMILAIHPSATPGEGALNEICPLGFAHYEQSVRVVELLEKKGEGSEPDLGGDGTGSGTTGRRDILPRWKEKSCGFPTRSPISTMISMMQNGQGSFPRRSFRRRFAGPWGTAPENGSIP